MFEMITPEEAGISSRYVEGFLRTLEKRGLATHSVLLMKGEKIFGEFYWKPFHRDYCHRMYSQTKSFVGVAIGLLEEDGLLCLSDCISQYFPEKIDRELPQYLKELTIRDLLTMRTCGKTPFWMRQSDPDRTHLFFSEKETTHPGGMRWKYDTSAAQVLCSLVEKLSGTSLFDFLDQRIFSYLGTFRTAQILKTRTEDSFGDSAMLCTTRDVASFARFVMNYGTWKGKRLMNEAYLRTATSPVADNDLRGFTSFNSMGYGYQIWCLGTEGFFFSGMGGQMTFCLPKQDLIFSVTADIQGMEEGKALIYASFRDWITDHLEESPLPADPKAVESCEQYAASLKLFHLSDGLPETETMASFVDGKEYVCEENPMGITRFSLSFNGGEGVFRYQNEQGEKELYFGMEKNVFSKFPQYGYSNLHAGLPTTDGHRYDCASSAVWREKGKMHLKVQIIDRYLGNLFVTFSFASDRAMIIMSKTAECFLNEYEGALNARLAPQA